MVSYEFRRRIRNQIRIVKKQIEENLQHSMITSMTEEKGVTRDSSRPRSPTRKISASSPVKKSTPRMDQNFSTTSTSSSTTRQSSTVQRTFTRDESMEKRSVSPAKISKTTTVTSTTSNRGQKPPKEDAPKDDKPIWTQKNILKKASENTRTATVKKVVDQSAFSRPKTTTTTSTPSSQPKDTRVTDCCVTSSYGIGPTDDNGRPIFGLRALKTKKKENPNATVTGTIVQETYYSENGGPATGERTVTMYSNDENQLKDFNGKRVMEKSIDRENSARNIVTVTKSQKIVEGQVEPLMTTTMSTNNNSLNRRGSVKEMSEKFIQKESEATKVNGSSSSAYPKAGLILRTQSTRSRSTDDDENNVEIRSKSGRTVTRKTTTEKYDVDEGSDDDDEDQKAGQRSSSTRTTTTTTRSFLNSAGEKVTDVNDVLDRMRNADNGGWRSVFVLF